MMTPDRHMPFTAMQPPETKGGYLLQSLLELKAQAEAQQPAAPVSTSPVSTFPQHDRYRQAVAAWLAAMTPIQRARAYNLDEIVKLSGLHGVNGKAASPQLVGNALHACGFVRMRDWTVAGRNRRYFRHQPTEDKS